MVFESWTVFHQPCLSKKLHFYSNGSPSCFCWLCSRTLVSKQILHFSVPCLRWSRNGFWYTVSTLQHKNQWWLVIRLFSKLSKRKIFVTVETFGNLKMIWYQAEMSGIHLSETILKPFSKYLSKHCLPSVYLYFDSFSSLDWIDSLIYMNLTVAFW